MIGIIDYGMGNLHSVENALIHIGAKCIISSDIIELEKCDKYILPGVGAFEKAIKKIKEEKFDLMLKKAIKNNKPILGICLGMQLLFESSTEFGFFEGLGLLKGNIVKLDINLKVPHMGWNKLNIKKQEPLFKGLKNVYVYFDHSYYLETKDDIISATCDYEKEIQVAAQSGCVYALQFHPEKSGEVGLTMLRNFDML